MLVNEYPTGSVQPMQWAVEGFLARADLCVADITISEGSRFEGETWQDSEGTHVGFYGLRSSTHVAEFLCEIQVDQGVLDVLEEPRWRDESVLESWALDPNETFLEACGAGPPLQVHSMQPAAGLACGLTPSPLFSFLSEEVFPKRSAPLQSLGVSIGPSTPWTTGFAVPVALGDALASVVGDTLVIETPASSQTYLLPVDSGFPTVFGGGLDAVLIERESGLYRFDRQAPTLSLLPDLSLKSDGIYLHPYWIESDPLELVDLTTGARRSLPNPDGDRESTRVFIDHARPDTLVVQNTRTTGSSAHHRRFWRVSLDGSPPTLLWRTNGLAGEPLFDLLHVHRDGTWSVTARLDSERALLGRLDPEQGVLSWANDLCSTSPKVQEGFLYTGSGSQRRSASW